jgi:ABC-type antimicrobial peptide transport system permease subunit
MHEFGVRIALGARMADVVRLVIGQGVRTVAIGVIVGVVLARAAARLTASLLFGIEPADVQTFAVVALALLAAGAAAAFVPAWRAARVDPVSALRSD